MVTDVIMAVAIIFVFLGVFYSQIAYEFVWSSVLLLRWSSLGLAVVLLSPISEPFDHWMHQITGLSSLNMLFGFLLLLVGVAARVYIVLSFLGDDHILQVKLRQVVQYPLSLAVPALVALFIESDSASDGNLSHFYGGTPENIWLILWWVVWTALLLHMLGVIIRATMVLRRCSRYKRMAGMALWANWICAVGAILNVYAVTNPNWAVHTGAIVLPWLAMIVGCSIALAADFFVVRRELED